MLAFCVRSVFTGWLAVLMTVPLSTDQDSSTFAYHLSAALSLLVSLDFNVLSYSCDAKSSQVPSDRCADGNAC